MPANKEILQIKDMNKLPETINRDWAVAELMQFKKRVESMYANDEYGYTKSHQQVYNDWYSFIDFKTYICGFAEGNSLENTWEKKPKVMFWMCIRNIYIEGHHATSNEVKQRMINALTTAINNINLKA